MALFCCTQKILKELSIKPSTLSVEEIPSHPLALWYANLTFLQRKKCVVFVNPATLFMTFVPNVSRAGIKNLRTLFIECLSLTLQNEGLSSEIIERISLLFESCCIGKTNDKKALGCLNDLIHHIKWRIEDGSNITDIFSITRSLNRMPWVKANFTYATEALTDILKKEYAWDGQFSKWR